MIESSFCCWLNADVDADEEPFLFTNNMGFFHNLYHSKNRQIENIINLNGLEHLINLRHPKDF